MVIPQAPRARDPSAGEPEGLRRARQRLLHRWALLHPTDTAALTLARSPLHFGSPRQLPFLAPHLTDWLVRNATGRGDIRTTVNIPLQRLLEQSVRRYVAANQTVGIRNASAMLVDTRNMEVKALVGSADHGSADIDGAVNGAFAKRSPGSALKPFIYALAMDESLIHPLTVLKDAPTAFGPYSPENFDGAFVGPITATDALIGSRNVPAVALASRLSQPSFYQFLKSAEISRLASERHYGLTLALGGGEVTMEELARLYAMLANGGSLRPLRYAQHAASDAEVRLLSPEASFMVLDMLAQNPRPDGAGNDGAAWMPIAWKTGTSWGFRDAWSAGIVGSYVLVVWVGNFDGRGNPAFVGIRAAAPLFFTIGDALATSYPSPPAVGFRPPAGVRRVEVCSASGDLPNADCPRRALTWFIPGRSPVHLSTVHRRLKLDIRTGRQACPSAPDWAIREEVYEFWPSDLRALFAKAGMPRRRPPESGDCGTPEFSVAARPSIASPLSGAVYQIRAQRLGADALNLVASGDGAIRRLYWFVDSSFVGQSEPSAPLAWIPPRAGEFEISVVDDQGASDSRTVRVGLIP